MTSPYETLQCDKFWRTAVANNAPNALFTDLWRPSIHIDPNKKIVTAGSCFAQKVGRWLTDNQYNFTPSNLAPKHNFSFAMGNIYTGALLLQWLQMALGKKDLSHVYTEEDGLYFDLLRPTIQPDGFDSIENLLEARQSAMDEMLTELRSANIFIFTLGLTECWQHSDGTVYPACPGTICGTYESDTHHFKNIGFTEYMADMEAVFSTIRSILNPNIEFLLTISPVPLTATASDKHVLPATVYSKSVLRSCAGSLADTHSYVDYFPSYELIMSNPLEQNFFEENRRDVTPEGVSFVMAHFEASLSPARQTNTATHLKLAKAPINEDDICEDIFLDSLNKAPQASEKPRYCLIGDSHMGLISKALEAQEIPHIGGMTMMGISWATGLFHKDDTEYFVPLESRKAREAWTRTFDQLQNTISTGNKPIILTNIGLQTRASIKLFLEWLGQNGGLESLDINRVVRFFGDVYASHIGVLESFVKAGHPFIVMSDPPLQRFYEEGSDIEALVDVYEKVFGQIVTSMGGEFLMVRDWLEAEDGIQEDYCSPTIMADGTRDWAHGSQAYYDKLTEKLVTIKAEKIALAS